MAYSAPTMATIRNAERADTLWYLSALGRSESLMWSCQVNDAAIATGARSFNVDTGVLHNGYVFADFATSPGLALYVTTATGVERVRFKGAANIAQPVTATVTVAQNNIVWADDQVLMLYHDYPIFPVFPRTDAAGVFYKDYDVVYTDENEEPIPVAIMGPDWAGWLVAGAAVAILDASDSYAIKQGAVVDTWGWVAEPAAGAVIDDAAAETTFVTFSATGFWWIKLTVTDDNGKSDYTRRLFWVHDASYPPIAINEFEFDNDYDSSVSTASFVVRDDQADEDTIPDEARLLVWSDDKLDGVQNYQGGWTGRQMSKWGGYVTTGSLLRVPGSSEMEFEADGVTALLDKVPMYSISLAFIGDAAPDTWWKYRAGAGITVAQAVHHLWRYHSTLLNVRDVILPIANTARAITIEGFEQDSLLQQAKSQSYTNGILANVCYNEAGVTYVEQDAQIYPAAIPAGFALSDADWTGDLEIAYEPVNGVSFLQFTGFVFAGIAALPIMSNAPGTVMSDRGGDIMNMERQMVTSQAQSNVMAGRVLAKENNTYPLVTMELPAALSQTQAFRIAPQQWHDLTIAAADTIRGLDWSTGKDLVVRNISAKYVPGYCQKVISFEPYTSGNDGVTGTFPSEPDEEPPGGGGGGGGAPPPFPPIPPPPTVAPRAIVTFNDGEGVQFSPDGGETWEPRNDGLPSLDVHDGMVLPDWTISDPELAKLVAGGDGWLAKSNDSGKTWTDITPDASLDYAWLGYDDFAILAVGFDQTNCNNAGTDGGTAWLKISFDDGATWDTSSTQIGGFEQDGNWVGPRAFLGYTNYGVTGGNCTGEMGNATGAGSSLGAIGHLDIPAGCGGGGWDVFPPGPIFELKFDFGPGLTLAAPEAWPGRTVVSYAHGNLVFDPQGPGGFPDAQGYWEIYDAAWVEVGPGNPTCWIGTPGSGFPVWQGYWQASNPPTDDCYLTKGTGMGGLLPRYGKAQLWLKTDTVPIGGTLNITDIRIKVTAPGSVCVTPIDLEIDPINHVAYVTYIDWELDPDGVMMTRAYQLSLGDGFLEPTNNCAVPATRANCTPEQITVRTVKQPDVADSDGWVAAYGRQRGVVGSPEAGNHYPYLATRAGLGGAWNGRDADLQADTTTAITAMLAAGDGASQYDRNTAFAGTDIYQDDGTGNDWTAAGEWNWTKTSAALPVVPNPRAVAMAYDEYCTCLIADSAAGSIYKSQRPYTSFTDITNAHPAPAGGIKRICWIHS